LQLLIPRSDREGGNSLPRTPYSRYRPRGLSRRLRHSHHMTKLARFVPSSGHRELSARHRGLLWPLSAKIFRRDRQSGLDRNRAIGSAEAMRLSISFALNSDCWCVPQHALQLRRRWYYWTKTVRRHCRHHIVNPCFAIPVRPDEGRLTEPTTAVQPWQREPLFVPQNRPFPSRWLG